jgi:hypothetical protein
VKQTHRLQIIALASFGFFAALRISAADAPLPTAKEVVERYDEALGGREAIMKHSSSTMRGTTRVPGPNGMVDLSFIFYASAPYLRLEKVTLPSNGGRAMNGRGTPPSSGGQVLNGFDGEMAWAYDPRSGPEIASGTDLESAKRDADFYYPLNELSWFKSMVTVGIGMYEGQRCYHLHGINNWNKSNDHFYDVQTGLLAGYEFDDDLPNGPATVHEVFSDYRQVDGVFVPMKQTIKFKLKSGGNWTVSEALTYTSVTFNDVDPAVYKPPQIVLNLATKKSGPHLN